MPGQGPNREEVGILGRKLGMTQIFGESGEMIPVTVVEAGPCPVVQVKTQDKDGYNAIQIGFQDKKDKHLTKAQKGHFDRAKTQGKRFLRELRQSDQSIANFEIGQEIKADILAKGDCIDVVGTSIGKGFQGVFKHYRMRGGKASHGVHEVYRHGGSLGCRFPQHVAKGKKMAGHMGDRRVTLQNLTVAEVRSKDNLILVRGNVPGKKHSLVLIKKAIKSN